MKKLTSITVAVATLFVAGCQEDAANQQPKDLTMESLDDKMSYILGYNLARQAKTSSFDVNPDLIALAINEVKTDAEPRFNDDEIMATMRAFQAEQKARRQEATNKLSEDNTAKGKAFLDENAKKEGVVTTESGMQYEVLTAGTGAMPLAKDRVLAHYRGTTLDGKEFDSSYGRGEPAKFFVGSLIPGWVEALQLMPAGSKWKLYIPGDLAYGPNGKMDRRTGEYDIEPNALLVFELELLEINPAEDEAAPVPAVPAPAAKAE